jgi:16S rRNA (guanine966-N2)-methyltransferase
MIRIIGGQFGSRTLVTPKGSNTRPTSSQIRAAVFNICQHEIEAARFLDICAGSGAIGFEALSRGAKEVVFIEHDRQAVTTLKENSIRLGVQESAHLAFGDALHALAKLEKEQKTFDIIYFDPPYTKKGEKPSHLITSALTFLDQSEHLVHKNTLFFFEESSYFTFESTPLKRLVIQSQRRFGDSQLFVLSPQE